MRIREAAFPIVTPRDAVPSQERLRMEAGSSTAYLVGDL
jgi:hypothetical protein